MGESVASRAPPRETEEPDSPTFIVDEGPGLVQARLAVQGPLCTADHMASLLEELTSLAALGLQDVTLDLSRVSSLSESAMDALLELVVETSPSWLKVRLDGWAV
jgi:hypothetical protein